jgi:prolipoprotein diacylglyceryltransferase
LGKDDVGRHDGPVAVPVHGLFVALGVLAATVVFWVEARRRGAVSEQSLAVTGALLGGAIGMRLSGWARHLDFGSNPTLAQACPGCLSGQAIHPAFVL